MPFKTPCYWGKEFHLNVCRHFCDTLFSHYTLSLSPDQCNKEKILLNEKIKITSELLVFLLEEIDRYVGNMEHLIGPLQILLRT